MSVRRTYDDCLVAVGISQDSGRFTCLMDICVHTEADSEKNDLRELSAVDSACSEAVGHEKISAQFTSDHPSVVTLECFFMRLC